jgi:pimeloyl-ACP methyl ester carboxylesterase
LCRNYRGVNENTTQQAAILSKRFESYVLDFTDVLTGLSPRQAIDLLGFGFTDRMTGLPFNPPGIKTHLYASWRALINQPVILVGTSMGGAAAIDFTLSYPQAVKKLILIDSMGYTGGFPLGQFLFPPLDFLAVEYWRQRKLQALVLGRFSSWNPSDLEDLRCLTIHLEMPGWYEAMMTFTKSGGYGWLGDRISQINQPTLILWGKRDEMLGTDDAYQFQRDLAQNRLVWLNCGHAPQLEQPYLTAEQILAFGYETV